VVKDDKFQTEGEGQPPGPARGAEHHKIDRGAEFWVFSLQNGVLVDSEANKWELK